MAAFTPVGPMLCYQSDIKGEAMGQILIRKLEDDVIEGLRARARANNRSVEAEARAIIGGAVLPPEEAPRRTLMSFVGIGGFRRTQSEIDAEVAALRDEWDR